MTLQDKAKQAADKYAHGIMIKFGRDGSIKTSQGRQLIATFLWGAQFGREQALEDLKLYHGPDRCHDAVVCDEQRKRGER